MTATESIDGQPMRAWKEFLMLELLHVNRKTSPKIGRLGFGTGTIKVLS